MSRPMTLKAGWKALAPFFRTSAQAGRWLALGGFLAVLTLVGSLGLLGLSGAFLTGAAIAGLAKQELETLLEGGAVTLTVGGQDFVLEPGDVLVERIPRPGLVVASEGDLVVALETAVKLEK